MLLPYLAVLVLVTPSDSTRLTLRVESLRGDTLTEWVLFDAANAIVEQGRTPVSLARRLSQTLELICAKQPDHRLNVELSADGTAVADGIARCFRFGWTEGRVTLAGAIYPGAAAGVKV